MAAYGIRRGLSSLTVRLLHPARSQASNGCAAARGGLPACISTSSGEPSDQREQEITQLLKERLPGARSIQVTDTSGGCGSMYRIAVAADEFKGQSVVKQHQLVTKVLEDEISKWHGFVLETKAT